jgi:hypothetical protein
LHLRKAVVEGIVIRGLSSPSHVKNHIRIRRHGIANRQGTIKASIVGSKTSATGNLRLILKKQNIPGSHIGELCRMGAACICNSIGMPTNCFSS